MAFVYALNAAVPANTDLVRDGAGVIRDLKSAIIERVNSFFVNVDTNPWTVKDNATLGSVNVKTLTPVADATYALGDSTHNFTNVNTQLVTVKGATITASAPGINVTQTWNNAAVVFTGAKFNFTDTASDAASLLVDYQVATVSKFKVTKAGASTFASTVTSSAGTSSFQGITGTTLSLSSTLTMTTAASQVIPGATSLSFRNNANNADNILIADAGTITFRGALTGITTLATSSTINSQTISSSASFTGSLTVANTATITAGGLTVTAGGITVTLGTSALQALTATTGTFSNAVTVTVTGALGQTITIPNTVGNVFLKFIGTGPSTYGQFEIDASTLVLTTSVTNLRLAATATAVTGTFSAAGNIAVASGQKILVDGSGGNTYLLKSGANEMGVIAGGALLLQINSVTSVLQSALQIGGALSGVAGLTLTAATDLQLGRAATVAAGIVSTHEIAVKDSTGTTYQLLAHS